MKNDKEIVPLIKNISEIVEKKANRNFKQYDITFAQMRVIMMLYKAQDYEYSFKELEKYFKVSQQTMAGIIKRLEIKEIVETKIDTNDKRSKNVVLTDSGILIGRKSEEKIVEANDWISHCLTKEEKDVFIQLLKKIYFNINEKEEED